MNYLDKFMQIWIRDGEITVKYSSRKLPFIEGLEGLVQFKVTQNDEIPARYVIAQIEHDDETANGTYVKKAVICKIDNTECQFDGLCGLCETGLTFAGYEKYVAMKFAPS